MRQQQSFWTGICLTLMLSHCCFSRYLDLLQPYLSNHGYRRGVEVSKYYQNKRPPLVEDCNSVDGGDEHNHFIIPPNSDSSTEQIQMQPFYKVLSHSKVKGHVVQIDQPGKQITILQPGCDKRVRETVRRQVWKEPSSAAAAVAISKLQNNITQEGGGAGGKSHSSNFKTSPSDVKNDSTLRCHAAVNAGFFDPNNGQCYGNLISQGHRIVNFSSYRNVHFGVLENGSLFFGYLTDNLYQKLPFQELVGGALWTLRNGKSYVNESILKECSTVEKTGSLGYFASVKSARTALAHDAQGRLLLVHVDGKTRDSGIDLYEMADLLRDHFQAINAINLDGGGSSTMVWEGSVINYPSDECPNQIDSLKYLCERPVTSIICAKVADPVKKEERNYNGIAFGLLSVVSIMAMVSMFVNGFFFFCSTNRHLTVRSREALRVSPRVNLNDVQYALLSKEVDVSTSDSFDKISSGLLNGALLRSDDELSDFEDVHLESHHGQKS